MSCCVPDNGAMAFIVFILIILSASLSAAPADPLPVLAGQGFRVINRERAFIAVSPGTDPVKRANYLYVQFEKALAAVEGRLTLQDDMKPCLIDCESQSGFNRVFRAFVDEDPPAFAVAVAIPARGLIMVDQSRLRYSANMTIPQGGAAQQTLIHEVAHLVLHRHFKRIPRWLDEGLAMWTARQALQAQDAQRISYWASRRGVMSYRDLIERFPWTHSLVHFAYMQSLSLVDFLIAAHGVDKVLTLLDRHQRMAFPAAWRTVFNESIDDTWEVWRRDQARRLNPLRFIFGEIPLFTYPAVLFLLAYGRYRFKRRRYFQEEE